MSVRFRQLRSALARAFRSWQLPAAAGVVVLLGLLWWLSPWKVRVTTHWDATNLRWAASLWWVWLSLAGGLGACAVARRYVGRETWERAWGARFFLVSVAAHAGLLFLLGYWTLPKIVDVIVTRAKVQELPPVHNDQQRPGEDGRRAFEKVADLEESDPRPPEDIPRADAPPAPASESLQNLAATITPAAARALPPERVLYIPPPESNPAPRQALRPLERRAALPDDSLLELTEEVPAPPAAVEARAESSIEPQVAPGRDALPTPQEHAPGLPQRRAELATHVPLAVEMETREQMEAPSVFTPPQAAGLVRQGLPVVRELAEVVESVEVPAAPVADAEQPTEIAPPDDARLPDAREIAGPVPSVLPTRQPDLDRLLATVQPASTGIRPAPFEEEPSPPQVGPLLMRLAAAPPRVADAASREILPEIKTAPVDAPQETPLDTAAAALPTTPTSSVEPLPPAPEVPTLPRRSVAVPLTVVRDEELAPLPPPAVSVSMVERREPGTGRVALARDRVDLASMFVLRDEETRRKHIELFGGTPATEEAVNRGLEWLARHQNPEGSWSLHKFHVPDGESPHIPGAGTERSDTAATGLALLAFLGGRHTHQSGRYQEVVAGGIRWLVEHQNDEGELRGEGDQQRMYSHGIATIALCEAYAISRDAELQEPARKALAFIVKAQHGEGGWRYNPGERGDTSVVGWQMMALKSGEMAGLEVPAETMNRLQEYLRRVEGNKPVGGQFGYQGPHPNPAMTAEGLLCLQFLGEDRDSPRMRAGADYLLKHLPEPSQGGTSYYWYYSTQVMYHMQGAYWETWNPLVRDILVESQITEGPLAGTWEPRDHWEHRGGRLYATALKLLMLEVYYRHLPLYEQLSE